MVRSVTFLNPRGLERKKVTRTLGGGGGDRNPSPSTFDTIHLIDITFGRYNELN